LPDEYAVTRAALVKARDAALLVEGDHTGTMYIWSLVPELAAITGLEGPELSGYMLRINLLLIQKAPLTYLQDVAWAFWVILVSLGGRVGKLELKSTATGLGRYPFPSNRRLLPEFRSAYWSGNPY
jgi:hypothetical protein